MAFAAPLPSLLLQGPPKIVFTWNRYLIKCLCSYCLYEARSSQYMYLVFLFHWEVESRNKESCPSVKPKTSPLQRARTSKKPKGGNTHQEETGLNLFLTLQTQYNLVTWPCLGVYSLASLHWCFWDAPIYIMPIRSADTMRNITTIQFLGAGKVGTN